MKSYKLGDNHEFIQRLEQLMNVAEKLNIYIDFSHCSMRTIIRDTKNNSEFYLTDIDSNEPVKCFPAMTEYKCVYEK